MNVVVKNNKNHHVFNMPNRSPKTPYRVQLVVSQQLEYFREVVLGVRHYGFETGRLAFVDRWLDHEMDDLAAAARRDRVQGIIAVLDTPGEEEAMLGLGLPVVNVSNCLRVPHTPIVTQHDASAGKLAAEHLRACGCRAFGFIGHTGRAYSDERWTGFKEALSEKEKVLRADIKPGERASHVYQRMRHWIPKFSSPAGIFAVLDSFALLLMRAARDLGHRVPEDFAILGAGDDDFQVEFESIPLSSIRLPSRKIGYTAAKLLDGMIMNRKLTAESVHLPVGEVTARKSTDTQFVDDAVVARAVRMIREQPAIRVSEVVREARMSRSNLQARFHKTLGRGLMEEIHRVRLARARVLLTTTNQKLESVADQSGFASVQRLSACFQSKLGQSPGAFRNDHRT
jgi:LacI family transcriptional regulator